MFDLTESKRQDRHLIQPVQLATTLHASSTGHDRLEGQHATGWADEPPECECGVAVVSPHIQPCFTRLDVLGEPVEERAYKEITSVDKMVAMMEEFCCAFGASLYSLELNICVGFIVSWW